MHTGVIDVKEKRNPVGDNNMFKKDRKFNGKKYRLLYVVPGPGKKEAEKTKKGMRKNGLLARSVYSKKERYHYVYGRVTKKTPHWLKSQKRFK